MTANLLFRKAQPIDVDALLNCFELAISQIDGEIYDQQQKNAWIKKGFENIEKWLKRIDEQYFIIAEIDNRIAGIISVSQEGYVDLLFTNPVFQRKGIASLLYQKAEIYLKENGVTKLDTHASAVSQPFFEKRGFTFKREEKFELYGVPISNFHLIKSLD